MPNLYQWAVNSLTAYPEHEGEQNVVFQIAWVCSATDGEGHNAATYGAVDVAYASGSPFTPYADLTLDQVNVWVAGALGPDGVAAAEAACDAMIDAQKAPVAPVTPPLPWNLPAAAPEPVE